MRFPLSPKKLQNIITPTLTVLTSVIPTKGLINQSCFELNSLMNLSSSISRERSGTVGRRRGFVGQTRKICWRETGAREDTPDDGHTTALKQCNTYSTHIVFPSPVGNHSLSTDPVSQLFSSLARHQKKGDGLIIFHKP